jgi:hypothetical protein
MSYNDKLTQHEIDDYGSEFLDVVGKKARQETAGEIYQLKQHVAHLEGRLAEQIKDTLGAQLDAAIPNWNVQNEDEVFNRFVAQLNNSLAGTNTMALPIIATRLTGLYDTTRENLLQLTGVGSLSVLDEATEAMLLRLKPASATLQGAASDSIQG